ncbi:type II secretion system protein [uncultured Ilyobacter sp.]|uniref:type II secretion system protein n=1 Tax=uncultured Ilyobacter sp. TaxID=544433 RepID=UPI0029F483BC|nr:type II secretion system protein [uncultured Ilyobacter sp.]
MGRRGFTLLEVIIVIALMGVVAAIVWPNFYGAQRAEQLDESARRMSSLVQMCRARAMNESRTYRIVFRQDGTILLTRQRDPILAPNQYLRFREPWCDMKFVLDEVWVESLLPLPDGPAPIDVEDDLIEFEEYDEEEPYLVTELDMDYVLDFRPDGRCGSLRWTLRDALGRGLELTLDGRLGRVIMEPVDRIEDGGAERPDAIEIDDDLIFEEDAEELEEWRPES